MSKQELLLIFLTIGVCFTSLRKPYYGISYFYLYYALEYNKLFSSLRFMKPLLITPLFVLISIIFFNNKKIKFPPQMIFISILFLWMCFSRLANGHAVWEGEEIDAFFKILFFLFLLTNVIDTKGKLKFFFWIMIIAYADLAFVARYYDTLSPYWMNKNRFAFSLLGAVSFAGVFAMSETGILRKAEAICYTLLIIFAIAGTNSRGVYLGLGIIFILLVVNDFKIKKLLFIAIPIILVLSRVSPEHIERMQSVSVDTEQGGTGGQRLALWAGAYRMMVGNPIFGVGSGESGRLFGAYSTHEEQLRVGGDFNAIKTHNMTLQIGADMGLVGLGLFFLILSISLRDIWQARKLCNQNNNLRSFRYLADGLGITIVGLFVAGQFGNRGYNLQFYTILCLAYCVKSVILNEHMRIKEGRPVVEDSVIPVKWEVPIRTIIFSVFTYMSLRL